MSDREKGYLNIRLKNQSPTPLIFKGNVCCLDKLLWPEVESHTNAHAYSRLKIQDSMNPYAT